MQDARPVVFYDGVCNLCNRAVQFIIKHDKSKRIMFASLQSEPGRKALAALEQQQAGIPDSIVLFDNGKYYIRSSAALRIAGIMRYPWAGLQIFSILPKVVRDSMYNIIARNRYKWFGKSESCPLPTPELKARMIT